MPIESWTAPEDAPDQAAHATAMIDAALVGSGLAREAYWAAVRKGYNTPYNDPAPREARVQASAEAMPAPVAIPVETALPVAAMAALVAEVRAP